MKLLKLLLFFLLSISFVLGQNHFWQKSLEEGSQLDPSWQNISQYKRFSVDFNTLRSMIISQAPAENNQGRVLSIELPSSDGSMKTYQIMESNVMESEIASRYPEIKTFKGTDGLNYMRMIITDKWLKAYILTSVGDIIIEPLNRQNPNQYGIYNSSAIIEQNAELSRICGESGHSILRHELSNDPWGNKSNIAQTVLGANPVTLITLRIAISCTGEFGSATNLGGGSIPSVIAKLADALTYANAVYEKDFAVHLNMVNSNDKIVFLDPDTDPFDNNGSGGYLLGQNTPIVTARIGNNFYDIGHVFNNSCTDVGGIANLGVVCSRDSKANGVTCWYTSDVAYVAQRIFCHEMGHQFSASHTFSNCNGNESGTRYEPGGGNTIMSYEGLCGNLNISNAVAPHPNYFHSNSIEQVYEFTRNYITCGAKSNPGNSYPVATVLTKQNLVIPIRTPFELKGSGSDMEDTSLTYNWEEFDNGPYGTTLGDVSSTGPLFRVFFPSTSSNRVIPQWSSIFNSPPTNPNYDVKEFLPQESRDINFRFIVRDNHPGAGGFNYAPLKISSTDKAGPFKVTFPNAATDKLFKNACNKIKWDVAGTFNQPVNCKKVDILMFKNREFDKPILLKANTDNDGIEIVDIPDLGANARVKIWVRAADNIFFDVSDRDIQIIDAASTGVNMGVTPNIINVCLPQIAETKVKTCHFGNFSGNLNLFIESGLPQGSTYQFGKTTLTESDETTLKIDVNNLTTKSEINIIVGAVTPAGDTLRDNVTIYAIKNNFADLQLLSPANGSVNNLETPVFRWNKSINANVYTFEIATKPNFGVNTIYSKSNIEVDSLLLPILLKENKIYYWRLIPSNDCGNGGSSNTFALQTVNKTCQDLVYSGNPVGLFPNTTHLVPITVNFNGNISDLNMNSVEIEADVVGDVTLNLLSPAGKRVTLFNRGCGNTIGFLCSFDDEAPIPLTCPPSGDKRMRPFEPLSNFKGDALKGNWNLEIITSPGFRDGYVRNFTFQYCAELKVTNPVSQISGPLRLNVGETKGIGNSLLLAQDIDNSPLELMYTLVSIPSHGILLLNNTPLTYGSNFTQKDIDDNKLSYKHTGSSDVVDRFSYVVEDGQGGWFGISNFDIFVGAVSTLDHKLDKKFQVYPNPTNGLIEIHLQEVNDKNPMVYICSLDGKLLSTINMNNKTYIKQDLSSFNNGIYLITLKTKTASVTRKLVINK